MSDAGLHCVLPCSNAALRCCVTQAHVAAGPVISYLVQLLSKTCPDNLLGSHVVQLAFGHPC